MRVLFLSLCVPWPPNNGQKMRTWAMLCALAAEGHHITFVSFDDMGTNAVPAELRRLCAEVEVQPLRLSNLSSRADLRRRFTNLFSSRPYGVERYASAPMRRSIAGRLAAGGFDAILCESVFSLVNVPITHVPLVLDNHNIEHLILDRYLPYETNPAKRLYAKHESRRLKRAEREAGARASLVLCCSAADCRYFAEICPGAKVVVAPNCVSIDEYHGGDETDPATILYQGGMDWFPNRDAVQFFVNAILPRVRREVPRAKFVIAGRNPSPEFRRRFANHSDVEFTGTVPDMKPVIARATVCVVPLRIGSGTRLKILEAAAMNKAIVSTRVGAEGLEFIHGEDILLADDPSAFGDSVVVLLRSPRLCAALGEKARRRVERDYSLAALQASLRMLASGFEPAGVTETAR